MQLHRIILTKEQLDRIPEIERRLFILLGHAANELNALSRLFHFAASSTSEEELISQAENAQAMILARTLTGKICEFWVLLQSSYFGSALSKDYEKELDAEAAGALDALKRYFGRANLIDLVRNKFAFHYSPDQVEGGYKAVIEGDSLHIYLAKHNANTLFAFAETITSRAMLEAIQPGDPEAAFAAIIKQTSEAIGRINIVAGALMMTCFRRYIGENLYAVGADVVEVQGVPESQTVAIPFFIEIKESE